MLYKWTTGAPPWSWEGASAIGVAALGGTLIRAIAESAPRPIRLNEQILSVGLYQCRLSGINNVKFSDIDHEWIRIHLDAKKEFRRKRTITFGMPRRLTRTVALLFGIDSQPLLQERESVDTSAPTDRSIQVYELCAKAFGSICIAASLFLCFEALSTRDPQRAVFCGAVAICGFAVGVASIRAKSPRHRQPPRHEGENNAARGKEKK